MATKQLPLEAELVEDQPEKPAKSTALAPQNQSYMELLSIALHNNAAMDVIERIAALQEKAQARDAEIQFDEAFNRVQAEIGRIAPDLNNPQTHSKYPSYAALDRVLRPVYTKHGFSLSFNSGDSPQPETVRVICYLSHRGGHTRRYQAPPMPADGKGAKGGDVMTKTHATGAAMSYGMRYLLKFIFNVAIGEDDDDGNCGAFQGLEEKLDWIASAKPLPELQRIFGDAYKEAKKLNDTVALKQLVAVYERRKRELGVDNANNH